MTKHNINSKGLCLMNNYFQDRHIHDEIIHAIDILLEQPNQQQEANRILESLFNHFHEKEHIFSLSSIVYGRFIQIVKAPEFQTNHAALSIFKNQLLGQTPYWATYALKYDFVGLLQGDFLQAYQKLEELLTIFAERLGNPRRNIPTIPEDLTEILHDLCYEQLRPYTIAELLVAHGCHILLSLPDDGNESYDILNVFGSIYPVSSIETVDTHLKYVRDILQKLQGKKVLFVDVHILPEGFVINFR